MATEFSAGSFLGRWIFALILVFGTYNPTDYSFISWITAEGTQFSPVIAVVGVLLLIGWTMFLRATLMSLGIIGIALGLALFGAIVWMMVDFGLINMEATGVLTYVALVLLSLILAIGMSWSHIRRRLSGQFDVDDRDD
ncbi:MAG: hypothetical protein ACJASY_003819 [Halioglobus sp.]|jgi:hypothetical protein